MPFPAPVIVFSGIVDVPRTMDARLDNLGTHVPAVGNTVVLCAFSYAMDPTNNLNEWTQFTSNRETVIVWKVWGVGDTVGDLINTTAPADAVWFAYELSGGAIPPGPQPPSPDSSYNSPLVFTAVNLPGDQNASPDDNLFDDSPFSFTLTSNDVSLSITPTISNEIIFAIAYFKTAGTGAVSWTEGYTGDDFITVVPGGGHGGGAIVVAHLDSAVGGNTYGPVVTWSGALDVDSALQVSFRPPTASVDGISSTIAFVYQREAFTY